MFDHSFRRTPILLSLLAILVLVTSGAISAQSTPSDAGSQVATSVSAASFRSSSIMFIENAGQWEKRARFQAWGGPAGTMWLADDAIWLTVVERSTENAARSQIGTLERVDLERTTVKHDNALRKSVNVKLSFPGANPHPRIEPFNRLNTQYPTRVGILTRAKTASIRESQAAGAMRLR